MINLNKDTKERFVYNCFVLLLHFVIEIITFPGNVDVMSGYGSITDIMGIVFITITIIINAAYFLVFIIDSRGRCIRDFIMAELFVFSLAVFLRYVGVIPNTNSLNIISLKLLFTVFILIHPFISVPTMIANYSNAKIMIWGSYILLLVLMVVMRVIYKLYGFGGRGGSTK